MPETARGPLTKYNKWGQEKYAEIWSYAHGKFCFTPTLHLSWWQVIHSLSDLLLTKRMIMMLTHRHPYSLSGRSYSKTLQQAPISLLPRRHCQHHFHGAFTSRMLCAGSVQPERRVDSCRGDSGGPLVCERPAGGWVVYGVTSWGHACRTQQSPGVYTRVSAFSSWIHKVIRRDEGKEKMLWEVEDKLKTIHLSPDSQRLSHLIRWQLAQHWSSSMNNWCHDAETWSPTHTVCYNLTMEWKTWNKATLNTFWSKLFYIILEKAMSLLSFMLLALISII